VSDLFPRRAGPMDHDSSEVVRIDPTIAVQESRQRWETRAAQWRARDLAELVFGGEVEARLSGRGSSQTFRGMLHLTVPFADLDTHRAREAVFLASAAADPVLTQVPFVFVLSPAGT